INADGSNNNTYVGAEAGENGLSGADENVLVGWRAGRNIAGLHNVCVGNMSGINNSGYANTFIGIGSGMTSSGQFNIAIGSSAGPGVATLNNTAAIGANCFPMASNSMILGDNTMNVGIGLSGIASGPLNKLEINTTTGSPYFGSINGSSGLRFRNMTSANTPLATVFNGVLSVDANGDVILVQDKTGGAGSVGNYCGSPSNPLLSNFEVPLANSNYHFVGDIPLRDKVNIGNIPCSTAPLLGKLNVNTAVPTDQSSGINSYSIHAINTNPTAGSTNTAVYGEATNPSTGLNFMRGVWGKAEGESEAIGVLGQAGQAINSYGGRFEAVSTSGTNYGIYAEALNGTTNYAVYASAGGVNYSGLGPDWAGYFDGDVFTTTSFTPSDKKLKKDIKNISNSLDIINKLNPVTYLFDVEANRDIRLPSTKQYGFISQEVKEVLPELTKTAIYPAKFDKSGKQTAPQKEILSLNYNGFIAILAEGIKEQQAQIEQQEATNKALQQQVNELKALVNGLISDKSLGKTSTGNSSVTLSDKNALVLNQNV
ncbi:MAG: tail fiber domain-containing protein, partial [Bacteroidetes bacterium]